LATVKKSIKTNIIELMRYAIRLKVLMTENKKTQTNYLSIAFSITHKLNEM